MQTGLTEIITPMSVMALIMATGYLTKRIGIFTDSSDRILSRFIINITCPAIIVLSLSEPKEYSGLENLFTFICVSAFSIVFSYFASKPYLRAFKYNESDAAIYRHGMVFGNVAYIGYPLCYSLFGNTGFLYASVYAAIQEAFLWSVGTNIMAGKKNSGIRMLKNLVNPNIIAIIIGFILFSMNVKLPEIIHSTLSSVGNITIPLAYMVVGSGFYKTRISLKDLKGILLPALYKLILIPAITGALLYFVNISQIMKTVLLLQISMPFAASMVALAQNYERDSVLASKAVTITTAACLLTLPMVAFLAGLLY